MFKTCRCFEATYPSVWEDVFKIICSFQISLPTFCQYLLPVQWVLHSLSISRPSAMFRKDYKVLRSFLCSFKRALTGTCGIVLSSWPPSDVLKRDLWRPRCDSDDSDDCDDSDDSDDPSRLAAITVRQGSVIRATRIISAKNVFTDSIFKAFWDSSVFSGWKEKCLLESKITLDCFLTKYVHIYLRLSNLLSHTFIWLSINCIVNTTTIKYMDYQ